MFRSSMLAALCMLGFGLHAEDLTLPITADNSLCIFPGEQVNNMGQSPYKTRQSHLKHVAQMPKITVGNQTLEHVSMRTAILSEELPYINIS